jgi:hypothetical protein
MSKKIVSIILITSLLVITFPVSGLTNIGIINVRITKPIQGGIYFYNFRIMTLPNNESRNYAFIFGRINIKVEAESQYGIEKVEFIVDNDFFSGFQHPQLKSIDYEQPYEWFWINFELGKCLLKVIAYDNQLNYYSTEIEVIKIM